MVRAPVMIFGKTEKVLSLTFGTLLSIDLVPTLILIEEQLTMKTYTPKEGEVSQDWYVVDAEDKILGRMATEIATRLRGKHKPEFAPHVDTGDFIVVINAEKIKVTGNKLDQKKYYHHTGYPGGIREASLKEMLEKQPEDVIIKAVRGMLPKNRLGRAQLKKLKVYAGTEHPHTAQAPKELDF